MGYITRRNLGKPPSWREGFSAMNPPGGKLGGKLRPGRKVGKGWFKPSQWDPGGKLGGFEPPFLYYYNELKR